MQCTVGWMDESLICRMDECLYIIFVTRKHGGIRIRKGGKEK